MSHIRNTLAIVALLLVCAIAVLMLTGDSSSTSQLMLKPPIDHEGFKACMDAAKSGVEVNLCYDKY